MSESLDTTRNLVGSELRGPGDEKIAPITRILLDPMTGEPAFAEVRVGRFGRKTRFVPLDGVHAHEDHVDGPWSKQQVKDAPEVGDQGGGLTRAQEAVIHGYFGV